MTRGSSEFVDTNVVVYAFTTDPRAARAQDILARRCLLSVQVLNEFANVARRKLGMSWAETSDALDACRKVAAEVLPISLVEHSRAVQLAERYHFRIYDAVIVASALQAGCTVLWSEDMHHDLRIDDLTIRNPFASP